MKERKKSLLIIVLLLLVGLTFGYVSSTYAKYTESFNKVGTVTVAKWDFAEENDTGDNNLVIEFAGTYDKTTLVEDKIAPGTEGSFNIKLTNANTETGVDFTLKIKSATNVPTNLKFYADSGFTKEITPGSNANPVTGQLEARDSEGVLVPIYWRWVYETTNGDSADTADGIAAKPMSITVEVIGVQTQPGAAITSHVD